MVGEKRNIFRLQRRYVFLCQMLVCFKKAYNTIQWLLDKESCRKYFLFQMFHTGANDANIFLLMIAEISIKNMKKAVLIRFSR